MKFGLKKGGNMNSELKSRLEEAAEEYQDSILNRPGSHRNVQAAFKAGAQFMLGYILREIMENALQQERSEANK